MQEVSWGAVVSALLLILGVGVFCGCLYLGVTDTQTILNQKFNIHYQVVWVQAVKFVLMVAACVMGVFAILLAVFGALALQATRHNVYLGNKCIMGGRISALFFVVLTYFFNTVWLAVTCALGIPIIIFVMLRSICNVEVVNYDYKEGMQIRCLNLSRFGLYFANYSNAAPNEFWHGPAVCMYSDLKDLCDMVNRDVSLFSAAFGGCHLIVLGLVSFLVVLSVSYQRIKTAQELTDYRDAGHVDTGLDAYAMAIAPSTSSRQQMYDGTSSTA